jgi:translation initiation factor IF-3
MIRLSAYKNISYFKESRIFINEKHQSTGTSHWRPSFVMLQRLVRQAVSARHSLRQHGQSHLKSHGILSVSCNDSFLVDVAAAASSFSLQGYHRPKIYTVQHRCFSENRTKKTPINEEIRAQVVHVVDDDGTLRENVDKRLAVKEAKKKGVDLVQVSLQAPKGGTTRPIVVCKMFDFQKKAYDEKKRKPASQIRMRGEKEVVYKANIATHDENIKSKKVQDFLLKGHPVTLVVEWGSRMERKPDAINLYNRVLSSIDAPYATGRSKMGASSVRARLNPTLKTLGKLRDAADD